MEILKSVFYAYCPRAWCLPQVTPAGTADLEEEKIKKSSKKSEHNTGKVWPLCDGAASLYWNQTSVCHRLNNSEI